MENQRAIGTNAKQKTTDQKKKARDAALVALGIALSVVTMFWVAMTDIDHGYMYGSVLVMLFILTPFYISFEKDKPYAREVVLIAVMVTIAVIGRAAFFWAPQFKPIIAIVIIAGIAMGPRSGFVVGSMSAFVSNFIFGQGPWTVFQMVAWGLIGMIAGALFFGKRFEKKSEMAALLVYGAASCFLIHGALTDLWTAFSLTARPNLAAILTVYATGLIADTVLAIATVIFLLLMTRPMLRKLDRVTEKYGMFE